MKLRKNHSETSNYDRFELDDIRFPGRTDPKDSPDDKGDEF